MGQTVEIRSATDVGDVLLIDTDRSFTGQDGYGMTPQSPGEDVPGKLARRLFELDMGIDHVYVLQNTVSVRRRSGWDEASIDAVTEEARVFLRHYETDEEELAVSDSAEDGGDDSTEDDSAEDSEEDATTASEDETSENAEEAVD